MTHHVNGTFLLWFGILGLLFCMSVQYYQWRKEKKDPSKKIVNEWDKYRSLRMVMGYLAAIILIIAGIILNK